jgi:hypothetical protein
MNRVVSRAVAAIGTSFLCGVCFADPGSQEIKACAANILRSAGICTPYVTLESATAVDSRGNASEMHIIGEVAFRTLVNLNPVGEAAQVCTGASWQVSDIKQGQRILIKKEFVFQKWQSGWRCATTSMMPIVVGSVNAALGAHLQ